MADADALAEARDATAAEPEDDGDYEAHVGAPLDPDYLARLSREVDRLVRLTEEVGR